MLSNQPPSYDQSQAEAREEAAAAMLAYQSALPPSYEEASAESQLNLKANYQLQQAIQNQANAPVAPTPEQMQDWYHRDLQERDRQRLWQQYNELLANDLRHEQICRQIKNQTLLDTYNRRRMYVVNRTYWAPDIYDFLLMQCLINDLPVLIDLNWRLNLFLLRAMISAGQIIGAEVLQVGTAAANGVSSLVTGLTGNNHNNPAAIALAVFALISALLIAPFAAWYTLVKCAKAVDNLKKGHKIIRSVVRLASAVVGAATGVLGGMVAGAMIGSSIPGVGTLAGLIVGAVLGPMITAGAATFYMKQQTRFISWLVFNTSTRISKTNPDKYHLNKTNQQTLLASGVDIDTAMIHVMMQDIKLHKPSKSIFIADIEKDQLNEKYNELLQQVKTNPEVSNRGYYLTRNTFFNWQDNEWRISTNLNRNNERPPAINPAYRGGH
jgi:hypothetical protein